MLPSNRHAFSLVELSIVLVILGLLVGGVLSGQSLIRAAELRAVTTEYSRYVTSVQSFRDKYFALPGDMNNATRFWGRLNGNADCVTNSSPVSAVATPGACDGNGDGLIGTGVAASQSAEYVQIWRQLALAGLIEGSYAGLIGSGGVFDCTAGTVCPRSRVNNAVWNVYYLAPNYAGDTVAYAYDYGNYFSVGGTNTGSLALNPVLKPEEAWNIDTKLDDGKPATGKVIVRYWNNACATSTSNTDYTGNYKLTDSALQCMLYFVKAF